MSGRDEIIREAMSQLRTGDGRLQTGSSIWIADRRMMSPVEFLTRSMPFASLSGKMAGIYSIHPPSTHPVDGYSMAAWDLLGVTLISKGIKRCLDRCGNTT